MHVSFHGAAREVTGSCHLIEVGDSKVLVDCGMFQGPREVERLNEGPFGFDPAEVDAVLLTHAHLDHCGRLPLLVRRGFRGPIHATAGTKELARLVMLDSAKIAYEEAKRRARKHTRRGETPPGPLYDEVDVLDAVDRFGPSVRYGRGFEVVPGVRATFHDAGHILGSAFIEIEVDDGGGTKRLVFSGDLGNANKPIVRDPQPRPGADVVVLESTYGDRDHRDVEGSVEELYAAIKETLERGGNVLIPTFALERAQEILYLLREGRLAHKLPNSMRVFLDSPMAISATGIFERHPEYFDEGARYLFEHGNDPFDLPGLRMTRDVQESIAINDVESGAVILAGSGMCTGGRIVHHLKRNLWREECSVVFVSFAARGTLARRIIDGAKNVNVLGDEVVVRATVHTINGFSAHADRSELLAWHDAPNTPTRTFLVHGDDGPMEALAKELAQNGATVEMPEMGQRFEV